MSTIDLRTLRTTVWSLGRRTGATPEQLSPADLAAFLTYDDRATYLAFVAGWKATYAELSERIRARKSERRETARSGASAASIQAELVSLAATARALLALRRVAKLDAAAKRAAARATAVAA